MVKKKKISKKRVFQSAMVALPIDFFTAQRGGSAPRAL